MTSSSEFRYPGNELEVFAHARNWKNYWVSGVAGFIRGDVLEVGAGTGANTRLLRPLCRGRYVSLEPDPHLAEQLKESIADSEMRAEAQVGTVQSLPADARFDTAVYIDVLEHIEDDRTELAQVARHIRPGGQIIVLSPAYQFLYSPFDKAIGHYRRYNRSSLLRCTPPGSSVVRINYLDSLGGILSLANRMLLRQSYPTLAQIRFWDRTIIPVSRLLDPLIAHRVGKSIMGVWKVA